MTPFSELLSQGTAQAWFFIPSAILLGALHGLEPGHSKTVMAAFIIAIRGTVLQAILLGLAATISHTAIVWAIALLGLYFGAQWSTQTSEPYLQIVSAILMIGIALWMLRQLMHSHQGHHHHHDETRQIDTGHGILNLEIFEDGVPPRWRVCMDGSAPLQAGSITLETLRPDGTRQAFAFQARDTYLESVEAIPEPHAFEAHVTLIINGHTHTHDVTFTEHAHSHGENHDGTMDAHEQAHAQDIQKKFSSGTATTSQIILFGLTGGLIPCPASITILLLCLQLKQIALGATLVLCFSFGLALTMVGVGVVAALGVRHASSHWSGFDAFARRAPYVSSLLIIGVGLYTGALGAMQIWG